MKKLFFLANLIFSFQSVQPYVEENGLLFMETSAKTAQNVNELFVEIGNFFDFCIPIFFSNFLFLFVDFSIVF